MKKLYLWTIACLLTFSVSAQSDLLITGIIDGPLSGGTPKAIELYALNNIDDLSEYGVGSANNGDGSDGEEFTFPAMSLSAGDFIYVASDSMNFDAFFGLFPQFTDGAANVNGDDAIELFRNGTVVDIFGDINTDGTGEPWEHLDGWAYRLNDTGPDGDNFQLGNWFFSGVDALDGESTNASAANPFPIGTYTPAGMNILQANDDMAELLPGDCIDINILSNDLTPNPVVSIDIIDQDNMNNEAAVQPNNSLRYCTTDPDCGYQGFVTYVLTDDEGMTDTADVFITVPCPPSYPLYTIETITTVDAEGIPDSLDVQCSIRGIVHGENLRGSGLQFTLIEQGNHGISVFSFDEIDNYTVNEGDELLIKGRVGQFNGLTQFSPDSINVLSTDNALEIPDVVTELDESTESSLVTLEDVEIIDPSEWNGTGSGFNVRLSNGVDTFFMRIDDEVDLYNMMAPSGLLHVTGIGGQFDSDVPYFDGYQLLPRYEADIEMVSGIVNEYVDQVVRVYPNPAGNTLFLQSESRIEGVTVRNLTGQIIIDMQVTSGRSLDISDLSQGQYILEVSTEEGIVPVLFLKQ